MKPKLLFIVNIDWFFLSHRLPIAIEALNQGYEVHVATGISNKLEELRLHGFFVHQLPIGRGRTIFVNEVRAFWRILRVLIKIRPDVVHLVTIKPVLYGGIAARIASVPAVVAAISGLGFVFMAKGWRAAITRFLVSCLYRASLGKRNLKVICQNPDDRETLMEIAHLPLEKVVMIPGSGVDLTTYKVMPLPQGVPVVIMAARLLRDKGVNEFVAAAQMLAQRNVAVHFWLVGDPDPGNPAAITRDELSAWENEGAVTILGYRSDIPNLFSKANIVVLPSYYGEGLPRTLVEAAACGRAVVTTDHPGCRDAIESGRSGLLVPVRNPLALADAIQRLIDDPELCQSMGQAGRALAEREFSIVKIVDTHMKTYKELEEDK